MLGTLHMYKNKQLLHIHVVEINFMHVHVHVNIRRLVYMHLNTIALTITCTCRIMHPRHTVYIQLGFHFIYVGGILSLKLIVSV